jgi:transposase
MQSPNRKKNDRTKDVQNAIAQSTVAQSAMTQSAMADPAVQGAMMQDTAGASSSASTPASSAASYPACWAGVDVSKDHLDVNCYPRPAHVRGSTYLRARNDAEGIARVLEHLERLQVHAVVVESSGGYERPLMHALHQAQRTVSLMNPRRVRDYARALGKQAKTDPIDALVLARFGADVRPAATPPPPPGQEEREALVVRRRQLIQMRTAEKARHQQTWEAAAQSSIEAMLKVLDEQIAELDRLIEQSVKHDPEALAKEQELRKVVGIGPVVSRVLVTELPELGTLDRGRIAALVGLAPFNHDSGKFKGQRAIGGGRFGVRCALYMGTLTATKANPVIKAYYQKLRSRGKAFKVAMVACMRKFVIYLNQKMRELLSRRQQAMAATPG